jgi:membrane-associated phospholipid phosphatase
MFRRLSKGVKKFWAGFFLLSAEMTIVVVLFVLALAAFSYIVRRVFYMGKTDLDNRVFALMDHFVTDRNNAIMKFFTFLGTHEFLIPANLVLIAYFLFVKKHRWYSIKIPAIALSSLGLMFLLKHLFNRPRPEVPLLFAAKGLSFPSGHALMSITFYGLLIYIVYKSYRTKWWRWLIVSLLLLLIVIIGLTRIYLRVHYTTDVIAGYCMGFLWLVFAIWFLNHLEKYSRRNVNPAVQQAPVTGQLSG